MYNYNVTCGTEGCLNYSIGILITSDDEAPAVICGPCSQPITNIERAQ